MQKVTWEWFVGQNGSRLKADNASGCADQSRVIKRQQGHAGRGVIIKGSYVDHYPKDWQDGEDRVGVWWWEVVQK